MLTRVPSEAKPQRTFFETTKFHSSWGSGLDGIGSSGSLSESASRRCARDIFERSVAWHFLEALAVTGYLNVGGQDSTQTVENMREMAERSYMRVRPSLTVGDEPTRAGDGIPAVVNFEPGFAYASRPFRTVTGDRLTGEIVETI